MNTHINELRYINIKTVDGTEYQTVKPATRGVRSPKDACVAAFPCFVSVLAGSHFIGASTAPTCEDACAEHYVIPCVSRF